MPRSDVTDVAFVYQAMDEYRTIGRNAFFSKYGRGEAKRYYAVDEQGNEYESKALYAAAYLLEFGNLPDADGAIFHGGMYEVVRPLQRLGITVRDYDNGQIILRNCVYPTSPEWLAALEASGRKDNVNFWRGDQRSLALLTGSVIYFKVRGTSLIGGRGSFRSQESMTISEAWKRFGIGNGVQSERELKELIIRVLNLSPENALVNCLILDKVELLPEVARPTIGEKDFPAGIMGPKFFRLDDLYDIQAAFRAGSINLLDVNGDAAANTAGEFDPTNINDARNVSLRAMAVRRGQAEFRKALFKAYGQHCAVSGATAAEVLEAAHIHPYRGDKTNHVQNGLLLRSDWHTLFDLGWWTVEDDFTIRMNANLTHPFYAGFNGRTLHLVGGHKPSIEALRYHRATIFRR